MFDTKIIQPIAEKYSLPPSLVAAIIQVESGGNPWAMRYEPAFFRRYVQGQSHVIVPKGVSRETEEVARATSFGLMQVMGQVARENGFDGVFLSALCDPQTGIEAGCKQLAKMARSFPAPRFGWDAVCAAYNGGKGAVKSHTEFSNAAYPAKVLKTLGGVWPGRV